MESSATSVTSAGDDITAKPSGWTFSGATSVNFDTHVAKSVPLYHTGHQLVEQISDFFVGDSSVVYDLGCATGTLTERLARRHRHRTARFIGLDIEPDMIPVARCRVSDLPNAEVATADISIDPLPEKADLVVMYYTLQFIPPKRRQEVLNGIYQALHWGGALLLFEKVRAPDARFQDIMSQLYVDYKIEQGYTPGDIIGKSRSLKRVLEPFSTDGNLDLLRRAGFVDVMTVQKYLCFEGFLAIK